MEAVNSAIASGVTLGLLDAQNGLWQLGSCQPDGMFSRLRDGISRTGLIFKVGLEQNGSTLALPSGRWFAMCYWIQDAFEIIGRKEHRY